MAPKKQAKVGESATYYRNNPAARKKKAATDKAVNKRPEQRKKRSELGVARTKIIKKKGKAAVK
tara:strand:- start:69 stop:260 length:192 start_codon:yes stop_codon:yes gene_type:complete